MKSRIICSFSMRAEFLNLLNSPNFVIKSESMMLLYSPITDNKSESIFQEKQPCINLCSLIFLIVILREQSNSKILLKKSSRILLLFTKPGFLQFPILSSNENPFYVSRSSSSLMDFGDLSLNRKGQSLVIMKKRSTPAAHTSISKLQPSSEKKSGAKKQLTPRISKSLYFLLQNWLKVKSLKQIEFYRI